MSEIHDALANHGVIPVIAIESEADALPLADALIAGGLPVAEITFRTAAAAGAIRAIADQRPEVIVGAGTVLTREQAVEAKACGARFAVAPGLNPGVVEAAVAAGLPMAPGVATPSEVEQALERGWRVMKFFPAGALGGPAMLKAMSAPYTHLGVRFIPTGGVNTENLAEYLQLPTVLAVGGTWIAKQADIAAGRWDVIADRCGAAVARVAEARG